jgi:flagellar FliL protein
VAKDKKQKPEGEEVKKKGGLVKKIVLLVVPLALGAAGAKLFLPSGEAAPPTTTLPKEGEVLVVETFTVNLEGDSGRFGRVGFGVVLKEGANAEEIKAKLPILKDAALSILAEYTPGTLSSAEGMASLREELSHAAHELIDEEEIIRVVLTEVVVQ